MNTFMVGHTEEKTDNTITEFADSFRRCILYLAAEASEIGLEETAQKLLENKETLEQELLNKAA